VIAAVLTVGLTRFALPATANENTESPYIFILDGEALFGYSDTVGPAPGDFSTSEKWLTSLAVKLNDRDQLIGAYNGNFQQSQIFIRQDEGNQSSNQILAHNLSAAVKKYIGDNLIFKPMFFYDTIFVKETADESLGDGLYDYTDLGGGFENTHLLITKDEKALEISYGLNVFWREYPNYQSLEALSSREPLEDKEKDFVGYKADLGLSTEWWFETTARLDGTALFKDFSDKLTVDANGIRKSDNRQDFYLEIDGTLIKPISEALSIGFTSGWKANYSNLDFYDTRNSLALTDDRFFENYYDYNAYDLSPTVTVKGPKFAAEAKPSTLQASYTFEKTFYSGRVAQSDAGLLLGDDQTDKSSKVAVQLTVPFAVQWSWMLSGSYEKQSSNQKFEQTFLYNYEVWSVLSGISFQS
jgi:hypothetical protein